MRALKIIKSSTFNGVDCDFYRDENKDIFMTREQVGRALEYSDPTESVGNLHRRNADRLNPLAVSIKLMGTDGKQYNTTVYTSRGIMEICRLSRQPKADAFMDWVWDTIEGIRKQTARLGERTMTTNQIAVAAAKKEALNIGKAEILVKFTGPHMPFEYNAMVMAEARDIMMGRYDDEPEPVQTAPYLEPGQRATIIVERPGKPRPRIQHYKPWWSFEELAEECGLSEGAVRSCAVKNGITPPPRYRETEFAAWKLVDVPSARYYTWGLTYRGVRRLLDIIYGYAENVN